MKGLLTKIGFPLRPNISHVFLGVSVLSVALLLTRDVWIGQRRQLFLIWNLALAWVPLLLAYSVCRLQTARPKSRWVFAATVMAWVCFLPNAPYLVTDLVHLPPTRDSRFWVELVITLLFAITGLLLGFASLQLMHDLVTRRLGGPAGWLFSGTTAILTGFGIYLGRFLRWNSWDAVLHPAALLADVSAWAGNTAAHRSGLKLPLLFAAFLFLGYVMLHALTRLNPSSISSEVTVAHGRFR